jgi:prephenate dehydrogenase
VSPDAVPLDRVLVAGAGLMGTSVALALTARGCSVHLLDRDPQALRLAVDLGAGVDRPPTGDPDLVVVSTPPATIGVVTKHLQSIYLHSSFTDLSSVKAYVQQEIEALAVDSVRFVGGHPLAGRERSGPAGARADLFEGRPWVLTPGPATGAETLARARALVRACGAQPVLMDPVRHDRAVALASHLPQIMASATAAQLGPDTSDAAAIAGQGLRDVTRIAASDPKLWAEIIAANAPFVLDVLDAVAADLDRIRAELREATQRSVDTTTKSESDESTSSQRGKLPDLRLVRALIVRGNDGRRTLPGKHGAAPAAFVAVPVVVPDRPGELARLFAASGAAGVNIEDVSIEHSPGQPVGLVELYVQPAVAAGLTRSLTDAGWSVHG